MEGANHSLADGSAGLRPDAAGLSYIYAYGSLMSSDVMRSACPSADFVIRAHLPNHEVQFRVPSQVRQGGTSGIVPAPGQLVQGVIYVVPDKEIDQLDVLESVPEGIYRKETFLVLGNDTGWYRAYLYLPAHPGEQLPPSPEYLDDMIHGATVHELDPTYIAKLTAWRNSLT